MEKMKRIVTWIIILTLISYSLISLINQNKSHAVTQTTSADINSINNSKYPGIKEKIQTLQQQYPNWKFKILYTGLDWNQVITSEYTGHGSSPKNLIYKNSNYQGAWMCSICGDKPYDNGSWRCTSVEAIKYMMDPRNSLNISDVFQFEELTNSGYNLDTLKTMTNGTFLAGHEQGIVDAAKNNNVNPYYIVARLIQEQGKGGTVLTSGAGYNGQYAGYYNAFNIAASGNTTATILTNALTYAQKKGWTSLESSINGGINFLATQYIQKGQNTLYLQKFDVETTNGLYSNQYMQNLLAAENEGLTLRNTYINTNSMSSTHTFIIPVYENMPASSCSRPDTNGISTTEMDLVKINVDSSLKIRKAPTDSTAIGWLYKDEIATRLEKATTKIGGTYWDKVQKSDGTIGYTARETFESESKYKLYLVPITENNSNNSTQTGTSTDKVKIDNSNNIIVAPNVIANDILNAFGGSVKITKANGDFLNSGADKIGTGYIVADKYTVVKKGDCNGDGDVNTADLLAVQKKLLGISEISETNKFKAVDTNNDGKIDTADLLAIQKKLLNICDIKI